MIKAFQTVYNFWHFKRQTCERASQSPSIKVLQWTLFFNHNFVFGMVALKLFLLLWQNLKWQNPFANVTNFCHLILKTFCRLDRANSIKTALQTCNLSTGLSLSYNSLSWFWLNLQWHFVFTFANEYILPIRLLS